MNRFASIFVLASLVAAPAVAGRGHEAHGFSFAWPDPGRMGAFEGGARLGVGVTGLTPELRKHFGAPVDLGVLISQVAPDSAAAAAGVEVGDVLVRLGDTEIEDGMQLRQAVQQYAGAPTSIEVIRDGRNKKLKATIAKAEEAPDGRGRVWVYGDDGQIQVDPDGIRDLLEEMPRFNQALPEGELDELHLRLDDLEQQLLEMTERMEQATERIQERLDALE